MSYSCFNNAGETPALLTDSRAEMLKLSEEVHTFAFDILFGQLKGYLSNLANMEVRNYMVYTLESSRK